MGEWEGLELREAGLLLRPWRPADVDAVYRACQDPDIQRWTSVPRPYRREHAEEFVTGFTRRWTTVPEPYTRVEAEYFAGQFARRRWAEGTGAVFALADAADLLGADDTRGTA